jgi:hypothetical protein
LRITPKPYAAGEQADVQDMSLFCVLSRKTEYSENENICPDMTLTAEKERTVSLRNGHLTARLGAVNRLMPEQIFSRRIL